MTYNVLTGKLSLYTTWVGVGGR